VNLVGFAAQMTATKRDPFSARAQLDTPLGQRTVYRLDALRSLGPVDALPYSIKVLLESCLRNLDDFIVTPAHVEALVKYNAKMVGEVEIPFEFQRNRERYEFLKWGQQSFKNFRVVPPATGIVHQVNLEYLATACSSAPSTASRWHTPTRSSAPTATPP
jgi:aconitase A